MQTQLTEWFIYVSASAFWALILCLTFSIYMNKRMAAFCSAWAKGLIALFKTFKEEHLRAKEMEGV